MPTIPSTSVLDNFNRANGGPGTNWSDKGFGVNHGMVIVSNTVTGGTSGGTCGSYWNPSTFTDSEVFATALVIGATNEFFRLWLRLSNPGATNETGYLFQIRNDGSGAFLGKETARETYTTLAQDTSKTIAANDQFVFQAIGSILTAYQNGTQIISATDSTYTSGNLALGCRGNVYRIDNFGGGTPVTSSIKTVMGQAYASSPTVKTVMGLAQASVKTIEGLA